MNISKINISDAERHIVSEFMNEEYPFEIDFNSLMPVVEKIKKEGWYFELQGYTVINNASFVKNESHITAHSWSTPLLATYNVCIDFIKWYNSQNK